MDENEYEFTLFCYKNLNLKMGFFRSEKMNLYKLSVPKDEAQTVIIDFS
jgi:hypothetical protein